MRWLCVLMLVGCGLGIHEPGAYCRDPSKAAECSGEFNFPVPDAGVDAGPDVGQPDGGVP
jgi:hypothetical protein